MSRTGEVIRWTNIPVHVLSPCSLFLDIGGTVLISNDVLALQKNHCETTPQRHKGTLITLVDPKPVIPIMAIMAPSSSFTASMASPSSGSPASVCAWTAFCGAAIDDCAVKGRGPHRIDIGQLTNRRNEYVRVAPCDCEGGFLVS